jgi:hypothetical protein
MRLAVEAAVYRRNRIAEEIVMFVVSVLNLLST